MAVTVTLKKSIFIFTVFFIIGNVVTSDCPTEANVISKEDVRHAAIASSEAYNDDLVVGSTIKGTSFMIVHKVHKVLKANGEGIRVLVADHGNTRIVVYRGTDGGKQLAQEGASFFAARTQVKYKATEVKILKFFWEAFELVSYKLNLYLQDPSMKYIITGHSLGGALASILALNTTTRVINPVWKNPQSCLITFGQPRVGDQAYADLHDEVISTFKKLRFVYMADIVARIPPYEAGYRHHSRSVYMSKGLSLFGKKDISGDHNKDNKDKKDKVSNHLFDEDDTDSLDDDDDEAFKTTSNTASLGNIDNYIDEIYKKETSNNKGSTTTGNDFTIFEWYWQICTPKRAYFCITKFGRLVPKISNHMMINYLRSISKTTVFYTRDDVKKSTLKDAIIGSCKEENV